MTGDDTGPAPEDLRQFSVAALHDFAAEDGVDLDDPIAKAGMAAAIARTMIRVDQLSESDRALVSAIVDDLLDRLDIQDDPVFKRAFKCALDVEMVVAKVHADRTEDGLSPDGYSVLMRATTALAGDVPAAEPGSSNPA